MTKASLETYYNTGNSNIRISHANLILLFLEKYPHSEFTYIDIAHQVGISESAAQKRCSDLAKQGSIVVSKTDFVHIKKQKYSFYKINSSPIKIVKQTKLDKYRSIVQSFVSEETFKAIEEAYNN